MHEATAQPALAPTKLLFARGEEAGFRAGDRIRISTRSASDDRHMPYYLRGKRGSVEAAIDPDSAEPGGYRRRAASRARWYRVAIPMTEIWPDYVGSPKDGLRLDISEPWLVRA